MNDPDSEDVFILSKRVKKSDAPSQEAITTRYAWLIKNMDPPGILVRPKKPELQTEQFFWINVSHDLKKFEFKYKSQVEHDPNVILRLIFEEKVLTAPLILDAWSQCEVFIPKRYRDQEKVWIDLKTALPAKFRTENINHQKNSVLTIDREKLFAKVVKKMLNLDVDELQMMYHFSVTRNFTKD